MQKGGTFGFRQLSYNNEGTVLPFSENIRPRFKDNKLIGYRFLLDAQQGLSLKDNSKNFMDLLNSIGLTSHSQRTPIQQHNNKYSILIDGRRDLNLEINYPFYNYNFSVEIGFLPIDTSVIIINNVTNVDKDLELYYNTTYFTNIDPLTSKSTTSIYFKREIKEIENLLAIDFIFNTINENILYAIYKLFYYLLKSNGDYSGEFYERYVHFSKAITHNTWITGADYGQLFFNYNLTGINPIAGTYLESKYENCPIIKKTNDKIYSTIENVSGVPFESGITKYAYGDTSIFYDLTELQNSTIFNSNTCGKYTYLGDSIINTNYANYIQNKYFIKDCGIYLNYYSFIDELINNTEITFVHQDRINGNTYEILIGSGKGEIADNVNRIYNSLFDPNMYTIPTKSNNIILLNTILYNKKLMLLSLMRRLINEK